MPQKTLSTTIIIEALGALFDCLCMQKTLLTALFLACFAVSQSNLLAGFDAMSADEASAYAAANGVPTSTSSFVASGDFGSSAVPSQFSSSPRISPYQDPNVPTMLDVNGQPVLLDANGQPMYQAPTPGTYGAPTQASPSSGIVINTGAPATVSTPGSSSGGGWSSGNIAGTTVGGIGALGVTGLAANSFRGRGRASGVVQPAAIDAYGQPILPYGASLQPQIVTEKNAVDFGHILTNVNKKTGAQTRSIRRANILRRYLLMDAAERATYEKDLKQSTREIDATQKRDQGIVDLSEHVIPGMPSPLMRPTLRPTPQFRTTAPPLRLAPQHQGMSMRPPVVSRGNPALSTRVPSTQRPMMRR